MITVLVRIKLPADKQDREAWLEHAKRIAPNFLGLDGLVRKHFILGEDGYGGGVYTWESRAKAEAFYAGPWRQGIIDMFGTEPEFTWFESPVIVDNEAGEVKLDETGFRRSAA